MSRKESRRDRRKQENQPRRSNANDREGISKVYYIVIGLLFVILIGLIIFIFSRSGDDVAINEEDSTAEVQEMESPENTEGTTNEEAPSNNEEEQTEESGDENQEEEQEETQEETEEDTETNEEDTADPEDEGDLAVGESATVTEDAPHDPDHTTNFDGGSADRVAIKNAIMQVTGLDDTLIEWWVGNNGPGRVIATVSDSGQNEFYDVYLQYGDGSWHVTSYERVSGN